MPSIFPDTITGGVVYRDGDGVCLSPPDVVNAYCPDPAFITTCEITALPSNCNARLQPAQINAIVSELLCLAETWSPEGTWDCSAFCNLSAAFGEWATSFAPNPLATVAAICDSETAKFVFAGCLVETICATVEIRTALVECIVDEDGANQIQIIDGKLFVAPGGAVGTVAGYIFESEIVIGADTDHDYTFNAGILASDDTVPVLMYAAAPVTKQADVTFAEGNNVGGMVAGETLPTSGTINLWRIMKFDGTMDACYNNHATSGHAPTLPPGFVYKRRVASLRTDGSANIRPTKQNNDEFMLLIPVSDSTTGGLGATSVLVSCTVPAGIEVEILGSGFTYAAAANSPIRISDPAVNDVAVTGFNLTHNSPVAGQPNALGMHRVRVNATSQFRLRGSVASTTFQWNTHGWIDTRGRLSA